MKYLLLHKLSTKNTGPISSFLDINHIFGGLFKEEKVEDDETENEVVTTGWISKKTKWSSKPKEANNQTSLV